MKRLIILRGNSGSGKSTVAAELQRRLGRESMCIGQDVVRRQILRAKEGSSHPTLKLMAHMTRFGWDNGYHTVIIEGILGSEKSAETLKLLISEADAAWSYYFDIPFEETLRRHSGKPNAMEFGESDMREWWKEKDYLGVEGETIITADMSCDAIVELIAANVRA